MGPGPGKGRGHGPPGKGGFPPGKGGPGPDGGVGTGGVMAVDPGPMLEVSIRIPRDAVMQKGDVIMYAVDVTPSGGKEPWRVFRSYQDFYVFCERLGPQAKSYPDAPLPAKTMSGISDAKLEERRYGLERWLSATIVQPQCKGPWLRYVRAFLEE